VAVWQTEQFFLLQVVNVSVVRWLCCGEGGMMISATFRNSFHLSFTIHKSRVWGGVCFGALSEEIHHSRLGQVSM